MVTIEILKWEKFNPRPDVKSSTWFRMDNSLPASAALHGLTAEERWIWVTLLCVASQKYEPTFSVPEAWLAWYAGTDVNSLLAALEQLVANGTIKATFERRTDPIGSDRAQIAPDRIRATDRQTDEQTNKHSKAADTSRRPAHQEELLLVESGRQAGKSSMNTLIAAYVDAFRARYGDKCRPDLSGRTQGLMKGLLKHYPLERLVLSVQAYCQMNDPWFVKKTHDFPTFYENIGKVGVALDTGRGEPGKKDWREIVDEQETKK